MCRGATAGKGIHCLWGKFTAFVFLPLLFMSCHEWPSLSLTYHTRLLWGQKKGRNHVPWAPWRKGELNTKTINLNTFKYYFVAWGMSRRMSNDLDMPPHVSTKQGASPVKKIEYPQSRQKKYFHVGMKKQVQWRSLVKLQLWVLVQATEQAAEPWRNWVLPRNKCLLIPRRLQHAQTPHTDPTASLCS